MTVADMAPMEPKVTLATPEETAAYVAWRNRPRPVDTFKTLSEWTDEEVKAEVARLGLLTINIRGV